MSVIALRSDNSPFSEQQLQLLNQCLLDINPEQSLWLSGYLAGVAQAAAGQVAAPSIAPESTPGLAATVLYGSQTGNARRVAGELADQLKAQGISVDLRATGELPVARLKKIQFLFLVISTHGEGDPPDDAIDFYEALMSEQAPKLEKLEYSVLALGDSSYAEFCKTGRDIDQRLAALGAQRFTDFLEADVDYENVTGEWKSQLGAELSERSGQLQVVSINTATQPSSWTRANPYPAELLQRGPLVAEQSTMDTWHVELSLEGSGLSYEPGDALGVWLDNDASLVNDILSALNLDGDQLIQLKDQSIRLVEALTNHLEITQLNPGFLKTYGEWSQDTSLLEIVNSDDKQSLTDWLRARQLIDVVQQYPVSVEAQALVDSLRPLTPRLYSIASSQEAVDDSVHLTVSILTSNVLEIDRYGLASQALAKRDLEEAGLRVYVEPNEQFRLPADHVPVIMIGAGTGVAPFRAFMQQREMNAASGDNWLLFGNRNFQSDFLYQQEWLQWRKRGLLNRIDVAFSRDHKEKHYVQHLVSEHADELLGWLENGAHLYLCGSIVMGHAVEEALVSAYQATGIDQQTAEQQLRSLRKQKRLHKDVY